MKKALYITAVAVLSCSALLRAQNADAVYETVDSLVYTPVAALDRSLEGKNIFNLLEHSEVTVRQSASVREAMNRHFETNSEKYITGYRVRIFFDNKQNARSESQAALSRFKSAYPYISAYHSYDNPFFKVTVGDFRTRSEAMQMLQKIQYQFPSAFVVKENINYPVVDKENAAIVDTIKVMRKVIRTE